MALRVWTVALDGQAVVFRRMWGRDLSPGVVSSLCYNIFLGKSYRILRILSFDLMHRTAFLIFSVIPHYFLEWSM